MVLAGRMPIRKLPNYLVAQFLGAIVLGWLNGTVMLHSEDSFTNWDNVLQSLMTTLLHRLKEEQLPVGHVKVIADYPIVIHFHSSLTKVQHKKVGIRLRYRCQPFFVRFNFLGCQT